MKYLQDRASAINPLDEFNALIKSKKSLRIKLGVDLGGPHII